MRGLRDCDPVTVYTSNLDLDRNPPLDMDWIDRDRSGSVVHTVEIIRIAIRISSNPDRDPDIFVPCKRGITEKVAPYKETHATAEREINAPSREVVWQWRSHLAYNVAYKQCEKVYLDKKQKRTLLNFVFLSMQFDISFALVFNVDIILNTSVPTLT